MTRRQQSMVSPILGPLLTKQIVPLNLQDGVVDHLLPAGLTVVVDDQFVGPTDLSGSGFWSPRYSADHVVNVAGGTQIGDTTFAIDPNHTFSIGAAANPFSVGSGGRGLVITDTRVSTLGYAGGEIPNSPATSATFVYQGGHIEARVYAQTQGYWEWTISGVTYDKSSWPAGYSLSRLRTTKDLLESDGFELTGTNHDPNGRNKVQQTLHTADNTTHAVVTDAGTSLYDGDQVLAILWTDTVWQSLLNGVVTQTIDVSDLPEMTEPQFPMFDFNVGSMIGGWVPPPDGTTPDVLTAHLKRFRAAIDLKRPLSLTASQSSWLDSLTVGGVIAALSSTGGSGSYTYSIASGGDPDGMFNISGSNLTLKQVVLAATKASHQVRLLVTDNVTGATCQRLLTFAVITATPIQLNYFTSQDVANAFWTKSNVTPTSPDLLLETAVSGTHVLLKGNITRAAGIKTFQTFAEFDASLGNQEVEFQLFHGNFGGLDVQAFFNIPNLTVDFVNAGGVWTYVANSAFLTPIPGTSKVRAGFNFTTDASTTNITVQILLGRDLNTFTYLGDVTKGMRISNEWLYNVNAGAGGS